MLLNGIVRRHLAKVQPAHTTVHALPSSISHALAQAQSRCCVVRDTCRHFVRFCITMCILGIALDPQGQFPVVIVNNRDEDVSRRTRPLEIDPATGVACYRDMDGTGVATAVDPSTESDRQSALPGGTWFGLNVRTAAFACLTNHRDVYKGRRGVASRGLIVTGFLAGSEDPALPQFPSEQFDGFNFVGARDLRAVCDQKAPLAYTTNRSACGPVDDTETVARGLPLAASMRADAQPTVHVIANTTLNNTESEPKSAFLASRLREIVAAIGRPSGDDCKREELGERRAALLAALGELMKAQRCASCLSAQQEAATLEAAKRDVEAALAAGKLPALPPGPAGEHMRAALIQRRLELVEDVFVSGIPTQGGANFATRTQSIVICERSSTADGDVCSVYYYTRDVIDESDPSGRTSKRFADWRCARVGSDDIDTLPGTN
jgi:uncharacterized protein with NRDE domain